jgi:hypothetical protein
MTLSHVISETLLTLSGFFYILLGTFFSILANFLYLFRLPFNQIDTYCLLLSLVLMCFGLAGKNCVHKINNG